SMALRKFARFTTATSTGCLAAKEWMPAGNWPTKLGRHEPGAIPSRIDCGRPVSGKCRDRARARGGIVSELKVPRARCMCDGDELASRAFVRANSCLQPA